MQEKEATKQTVHVTPKKREKAKLPRTNGGGCCGSSK